MSRINKNSPIKSAADTDNEIMRGKLNAFQT